MKKVRLRYYKKEDFDFLHEMLSDPETVKFFPLMYTTSKEQSRLRLETRLWDEESDYANRYVIQDFFTICCKNNIIVRFYLFLSYIIKSINYIIHIFILFHAISLPIILI